MKAPLFTSLAALSIVAFALPASGHTVLKNPMPITGDANAKSGPCGCYFGDAPQDPADDMTPVKCPDMFPTTTLKAGTPLKVDWQETIDHDGSFRVTFSNKPPQEVTKADMDGLAAAEIPDMNKDTAATLSNMITLPMEPCDSCTIQVRQTMTGANPPYYYSCASVKVVASAAGSGGTGGAGGGGTGGGGQPGSGGDGEVPSSGAGLAEPDPKVTAGCSSANDSGTGSWAVAIAALSLVAAGRRRKTSR